MDGYKAPSLPPLTSCDGCGVVHRSWRKHSLCAACVKATVAEIKSPAHESLREYRQRINRTRGGE